MDKKYFDDQIDGSLAVISETLYKFGDEIVNLHLMVEHIRIARDMQARVSGKVSHLAQPEP